MQPLDKSGYNFDPSIGYYVTMDQITEAHPDDYEAFITWHKGQTTGIVNYKPAIYVHDYEKWFYTYFGDSQ